MVTRADARATLRPADGHVPMPPEAVGQTLAQALEGAAARHAVRPAVVAGGRHLTYRELDRAANRVAHALHGVGSEPGVPVAVVAAQEVELAVAIVGVLKAGLPFVPLDARAPASRARETLREIGARAIVATPSSEYFATGLADPATREDSTPSVIVASAEPGGPATAPPRHDDPDTLAYVYFTSGSTGRPKGVMDTHRNVLDNVRRYTNSLAIGPDDRMSLVQNIAFSGAVSSLFGAFVNGACSLPFDVGGSTVAGLRDWAVNERITLFHAVPVIFRALTSGRATFPDVRVVRLEGDTALWADLDRFRGAAGRDAVLVNGLGTTETGLVRQFFVDHRTPGGTGGLPLGYPVEGVEVEVEVDDGEIVVVGRHLALGYWGDPDRTAAAFTDRGDGRRAYRTGDLGSLEADGRLIGLGRRDLAEKVRGETVDLAEVEHRLRDHPDVADAAAITRRDGRDEPRVIAYIVPTRGAALDTRALRLALSVDLPASAVPAAIVSLAALPLDGSAKIDRRALPAPPAVRPDLATPFVAPRTELERELAGIWETLLGLRPIGVHDEFFELGGDSLDAAWMVEELATITTREVADDVVLTASTIEDLARRIEAEDSRRTVAPVMFAIHDDVGNVGFYARVARATDGALDLRTVGPGPGRLEPFDVDVRASEHLASILATRDGPYRIVGFCSAAPIALEVAHRLQDSGRPVDVVVLLGISPMEFPDLIDPSMARRPNRGHAFRQRVRRHAAEVRARGRIGGMRYVLDRAAGRARRLAGHRPPDADYVRDRAITVAAYPSRPFDGRVVVVLGRSSAALYSRTPVDAWHRLGRDVRVLLLPGDDHAMLIDPVARDLAAILLDAAAPDPDARESAQDTVNDSTVDETVSPGSGPPSST